MYRHIPKQIEEKHKETHSQDRLTGTDNTQPPTDQDVQIHKTTKKKTQKIDQLGTDTPTTNNGPVKHIDVQTHTNNKEKHKVKIDNLVQTHQPPITDPQTYRCTDTYKQQRKHIYSQDTLTTGTETYRCNHQRTENTRHTNHHNKGPVQTYDGRQTNGKEKHSPDRANLVQTPPTTTRAKNIDVQTHTNNKEKTHSPDRLTWTHQPPITDPGKHRCTDTYKQQKKTHSPDRLTWYRHTQPPITGPSKHIDVQTHTNNKENTVQIGTDTPTTNNGPGKHIDAQTYNNNHSPDRITVQTHQPPIKDLQNIDA
ncbi:unnamed protein product [Mytilus coruscus]|uniref:Uncharacterized protein n=1 Tax=Mytilus coruscus TaxID=42192 RepID=A0A6J8BBK3_MYTCO|nr:unnamed protein product [Mytilus coruscus]